MKPRTCGNCFHGHPNGTEAADSILCFGAPPTVVSVTQTENGGFNVTGQSPILPKARGACALHSFKNWRQVFGLSR